MKLDKGGRGTMPFIPLTHCITGSYFAFDIENHRSVFSQSPNLTCNCWAHSRGYSERVLENDNERALLVMKLIRLLYAIESITREQGLTHDQRHALRLEKSLPAETACRPK
jgi:hypothetical protein